MQTVTFAEARRNLKAVIDMAAESRAPVLITRRRGDNVVLMSAEDAKVLEKLNGLIEECRRDPFRGTGKPEALKQNLTGWWSRRITREHRLVYRVRGSGEGQALEVLSCRYHYLNYSCSN